VCRIVVSILRLKVCSGLFVINESMVVAYDYW
jgi:hypothetical protein